MENNNTGLFSLIRKTFALVLTSVAALLPSNELSAKGLVNVNHQTLLFDIRNRIQFKSKLILKLNSVSFGDIRMSASHQSHSSHRSHSSHSSHSSHYSSSSYTPSIPSYTPSTPSYTPSKELPTYKPIPVPKPVSTPSFSQPSSTPKLASPNIKIEKIESKPVIISTKVYVTTFGNRTLKMGMEGIDVTELQQILTNLGYYVDVTSVFGQSTKEEVMSFQAAEGLNIDGVVGPNTIAKLKLRNK